MIGDSYVDPAFSNTALDLFANAQGVGALPPGTTYRHYYEGSGAMDEGSLQSSIPYQFTSTALTDSAVANPADIDTVIMVGGLNDLLGDSGCETLAPPGNTACAATMKGVADSLTRLGKTMAANGVKHVVFFFYPHLDPAGGGRLLASAPAINDSIDYGYPLVEQACCGTAFVSSSTTYSCKGDELGPECLFIDTRPAFEGHVADYINPSDHVDPSPMGAQVLGALLWWAMADNCIAQ